MLLIDNTQYTAFMKCPLYWFERYVNKLHKPIEGPRQDALAVGVHFHSMLENYYSGLGRFASPDVVEEYPLTKEAQLEVDTMVSHYTLYYPKGPLEFPWIGLENAIQGKEEALYFNTYRITAKLDGYFEVSFDKPFNFDDGLGHRIELPPGIWGFETKTKSAKLDRGLYMKEWQAHMQASFQLLALRDQLPIDKRQLVRGILVNVVERPLIYEPRKSCTSCKSLQYVYTYKVVDTKHVCSLCGHANDFKVIPKPKVDPPFFWRFLVERSMDRLQKDADVINKVAGNMLHLIQRNETLINVINDNSVLPIKNTINCVNTFTKTTCEYFEPHNAYVPMGAKDALGFKLFNPTKYLEPKKEE